MVKSNRRIYKRKGNMISKRELMIRLVDVEMQCMRYEEDIRELQLKLQKLEGKKTVKKATKKTVKKTTKKGTK